MDLINRVRKYLDERSLMRGLDPDEIHALHVGHADKHAVLLADDLRALLARIVELEKDAAPDRGAFEAWYQNIAPSAGGELFIRDGEYIDPITAVAWEAWQAAMSQEVKG